MENNIWYDSFIETLYQRYPKKQQLAQQLMDLLFIEREAVYRRLRKDVIFTFHEIVKIASAWNISLDEITGVNSGQVSFVMRPVNILDPSEKGLNLIRQVNNYFEQLDPSGESEYMEICNKLPRSLVSGLPFINRFYIFKWAYQYGNEETDIPYSQTIIPERMRRLMTDFYQAVKNVANMNYIWDHMLFDYLVRDIQYFHSILLITDEEKELIRGDLYALLDYLSEVAGKGSFPETKNKVNLYISQINIDTNYSYFYAENFKMCRIHVFSKHEIYTYDPEMISNFRTWMLLKKRSSVQISEVDERSRIEFFMKQRQLIDSL